MRREGRSTLKTYIITADTDATCHPPKLNMDLNCHSLNTIKTSGEKEKREMKTRN